MGGNAQKEHIQKANVNLPNQRHRAQGQWKRGYERGHHTDRGQAGDAGLQKPGDVRESVFNSCKEKEEAKIHQIAPQQRSCGEVGRSSFRVTRLEGLPSDKRALLSSNRTDGRAIPRTGSVGKLVDNLARHCRAFFPLFSNLCVRL